MSIDHPKATSTPTSLYPVRGRKGIRENDSVQSPIEELNTRFACYSQERSQELSPSRSPRLGSRSPKFERGEPVPECWPSQNDSDPSQSESDEPSQRESHNNSPNSDTQSFEENQSIFRSKYELFIRFLAIVALGWMFGKLYKWNDPVSTKDMSKLPELIAKLEDDFSKQEYDFWRKIRVNIKEVAEFDQPRSIIFLYEGKATKTMKNILKGVSRAAECHLKDCSHQPVQIQGSQLNTTDIMKDYGKIISRFRGPLEEKGVLIVEHLEQVPGSSAQAFHDLCDEYNAVVQKALFLFTLEVDKLPDNNPTAFVETFLLNLWKDLGVDDKFYPLFTRISGTVLRVQTK